MYRYLASFLARSNNVITQVCQTGKSDDDRRQAGSRKSSRSRSRARQQMTYEACEPRLLLTTIHYTASTGEVLIGGSDAVDVARVTQVNNTVTVTHQNVTETFAASDVNSIVFVGLGGDDFFENQTAIFANALGQGGNDTLIGGSGADRLIGNNGDDVLTGNAGDDFILAGNGDDIVVAGDGNDRILGVRGFNNIDGGAGNDEIFGGLGIDFITVASGNNILVGEDGNDVINGGTGEDLIFGGDGEDVIRGNAGNDRIYAQNGNDEVSGGSGDDIVNGNNGDDVLQGEQGDDLIIGADGNDLVNFSGVLADYDVSGNLIALTIDDLRGPNFGLEDFVIFAERFSFGDGERSANETLNPTAPPPGGNVREVVTVQPIIAANSDGSNAAEFFGNSAQEADILRRIDEIFAQADIDIEFLPARQINDTFTNVGNGTGTRASADLNRIVSNGDARGIGSSDRNVIDLYFVERVPAFDDIGDSVANGLAFVGSGGIAMHVGDNLVDFAAGRDTIAAVTAHEIGHNLGLSHVSGNGNLLSEGGRGTDLTDSQINTIFRSSFSQPVTSATQAQADSQQEDFVQQNELPMLYGNPQADSEATIGGCGGCGFCAACTGTLS